MIPERGCLFSERTAPALVQLTTTRSFSSNSSFFFSSRRRHTRYWHDWSSDVCSSDLSWERLRCFAYSIAFLISDVLPFGRLWYGEPNAISNAIEYAKHRSRSHDAVIRVYDSDWQGEIGRASCRERGSEPGGEALSKTR